MTRAQDTTPATGLSGTMPFFDIGQERTEAMVALQRELSEIARKSRALGLPVWHRK